MPMEERYENVLDRPEAPERTESVPALNAENELTHGHDQEELAHLRQSLEAIQYLHDRERVLLANQEEQLARFVRSHHVDNNLDEDSVRRPKPDDPKLKDLENELLAANQVNLKLYSRLLLSVVIGLPTFAFISIWFLSTL